MEVQVLRVGRIRRAQYKDRGADAAGALLTVARGSGANDDRRGNRERRQPAGVRSTRPPSAIKSRKRPVLRPGLRIDRKDARNLDHVAALEARAPLAVQVDGVNTGARLARPSSTIGRATSWPRSYALPRSDPYTSPPQPYAPSCPLRTAP